MTELPEVADPGQVAPQDARELSKQFFRRLTELEEGTHEYQYARNTLIEMNMSLVRYAAGRFRSRGPEGSGTSAPSDRTRSTRAVSHTAVTWAPNDVAS